MSKTLRDPTDYLARCLYDATIALRPTWPEEITPNIRAPWRIAIWREAAEAARQVLSRNLSLAEALRLKALDYDPT